MSLVVVCPHCGRRTESAEVYAGMQGPCADCGQTVRVPKRRKRRVGAFLMVIAVVLLAMLLLPLIRLSSLRPAPDKPLFGRSSANLSRIGAALLTYHAQFGSYPPPVVYDENGAPMHSWRVLLLPYLGERELYEYYRFEEPWNSEHNIRLTTASPPVYDDPQNRRLHPGCTPFLAVTGRLVPFGDASRNGTPEEPLSVWQAGEELGILAIELKSSNVAWTQPVDLDAETLMYTNKNFSSSPMLEFSRADQVRMLYTDGLVRYVGPYKLSSWRDFFSLIHRPPAE